MTTTVAVIAAGEMGCSIGERLRRHGARVLTSLAGRSAATVERATRAGLIDADDDAIAAADFILSIVPPKDAMAIAQRFQGPLQRSSKKAVYIDCNAVSVETVAAIEKVVTASGGRFVDGSIIGPPARKVKPVRPFIWRARCRRTLRRCLHSDCALQSTGGPVGAASALKMAYAGLNKGLTALAAAMALAATRAGAANGLREELAYSQPQLLAHIGRTLPDMYPKAHRWEFEMREVAAFAGEDSSTAQIFEGIADLYLQLAKDWKGERRDVAAIDNFLATKRP